MTEPITPQESKPHEAALGCLSLIGILIVLFMLLKACSTSKERYWCYDEIQQKAVEGTYLRSDTNCILADENGKPLQSYKNGKLIENFR